MLLQLELASVGSGSESSQEVRPLPETVRMVEATRFHELICVAASST